MPKYMVQSMDSGTLGKVKYYRKQTIDHPNHKETGAFTQAAKDAYASSKNINAKQVEVGSFMSGQPEPSNAVSV
ncbi:hypothetical protein CH54_472 [Yersinia rochesterensis]|uniref:Uncharacterized protein n=2 Tax=Yersiniaceae TaxID=1903411 RepID=A0A386HEL2_9GAMM|nr:hypothetical protein [Yersinia rochesterensis]AJI86936.1 hypothetical protein AW19_1190 [Yersinia frederiksenii Y225]CNH40131.1 Uncharacterised protein [Yersinia kristensenii]AIN19357.1 hypothetical protein DJ57_1323 [Yersinia rochesterensis]AJJ35363.1 hypothetical protein CH54_472 [Yersinia rochesterensis]AYD44036.1 hypothetical protein DXZ79_10200 [Yersinia rochesterensis]